MAELNIQEGRVSLRGYWRALACLPRSLVERRSKKLKQITTSSSCVSYDLMTLGCVKNYVVRIASDIA